MSERLLLDEHYPAEIAERLRADGHDVTAVVADVELRALPDAELVRWAAARGRRIMTENIEDFRPLLLRAYPTGAAIAPVLLVSPRRFPRGSGDRTEVMVKAVSAWLRAARSNTRPDEDWLG